MATKHLKYYSQLDGLRCFAVVAVMIGHWIAWDARSALVKNIPWGHGVILFFVLSGYLISNILFTLKEELQAGQVSLKKALTTFYIRRFLRIFPAYYALLFFLYYINHNNTRGIFPWLVTFTSNLLQCRDGEFLGDFNHFWSLAVEEQFYILWPFMILLTPAKHMLKVIVGFMALSLVCRSACYFQPNWMVTAYFTPNLFFPLCLGALLAYARRYHHKLSAFFRSYGLLLASLALYAGFYCFHQFACKQDLYKMSFMKAVLDEYVFSVAMAFIIFRASRNGFKYLAGFILTHEVVVFIGRISYGLYVYHLFVIGLFWNYLSPRFQITVYSKYATWLVFFIICFGMALLSYYIIEKPFNALKKRYKY